MHGKLTEILGVIEERLLKDDITSFKIGITGNWEERKQQHHRDGYSLGSLIARGDDAVIGDSEKELINWSSTRSFSLQLKCKNNQDAGGKGTGEADTLYIVAKGELAQTSSAILDNLRRMSIQPLLLNFEPVILY